MASTVGAVTAVIGEVKKPVSLSVDSLLNIPELRPKIASVVALVRALQENTNSIDDLMKLEQQQGIVPALLNSLRGPNLYQVIARAEQTENLAKKLDSAVLQLKKALE